MTRPGDGEVVVASMARTPFGRFSGALAAMDGPTLGAAAIDAAVERAGIDAHSIDAAYAGVGMIGSSVLTPARQAVLRSRLPDEMPSMAIDRACCSGMTAVGTAFRDIRLDEIQAAVCGGFDSLSNTPFLWPRQRGHRPGPVEVRDPLTLRAEFLDKAIAAYTGEEAVRAGVGREEQDEWAAESHRRYFAAEDKGFFARERVPIAAAGRDGGQTVVETDESPRRDTSLDRLAKLDTVYGSPTVTAGNAPGLNDGAAFLVVMSRTVAGRLGATVLATIIDHVQVAGGPTSGSYLPAIAIAKALDRQGLTLDDLDLLEINEAFAATPLVSTLKLADGDRSRAGKLRQRTNVNGGAVAIGHPLGASGARLVMTLAAALLDRGGGLGAAAICGGYGQADAILLRVDGD